MPSSQTFEFCKTLKTLCPSHIDTFDLCSEPRLTFIKPGLGILLYMTSRRCWWVAYVWVRKAEIPWELPTTWEGSVFLFMRISRDFQYFYLLTSFNFWQLSDRGLYKYLTRSQIIVNRRNRNSRCGINNIDSWLLMIICVSDVEHFSFLLLVLLTKNMEHIHRSISALTVLAFNLKAPIYIYSLFFFKILAFT